MLQSKFEYIYFSCSPYHLTNKKMQNIIKQVDASKILPESISPHLKIPEVNIIRRCCKKKQITFLFLVPKHLGDPSHLRCQNIQINFWFIPYSFSWSSNSNGTKFPKFLSPLETEYTMSENDYLFERTLRLDIFV